MSKAVDTPAGPGLRLHGVPAGVAVAPVHEYRTDAAGQQVPVKTRRGLLKLERVELVNADAPGQVSLEDAEERFVLARARQSWGTVEKRYGEHAWERALTLVRAGVVRLRCEVDDQLRLGQPTVWLLTDEWATRRAAAEEASSRSRREWQSRADAAVGAVEDICAELAAAIGEARGFGRPTQVLICAAEDLAEGVAHDGPRGFSQAHFGETKVADDVADILRSAGVPEAVPVHLGVRRGTRLGIAGPIDAELAGETVSLSALDGPVLFRVDQPGLTLRLRHAAPLVVVENLQAAEAVADRHDGVAVIYTAGPLSDVALGFVESLGKEASSVGVVPDADLGGVRIAEPLLLRLPGALLIDIGRWPHPKRPAWPVDGVSMNGLRAALDGPARELAAACLERGYPVEQELATVRAVTETLA